MIYFGVISTIMVPEPIGRVFMADKFRLKFMTQIFETLLAEVYFSPGFLRI